MERKDFNGDSTFPNTQKLGAKLLNNYEIFCIDEEEKWTINKFVGVCPFDGKWEIKYDKEIITYSYSFLAEIFEH